MVLRILILICGYAGLLRQTLFGVCADTYSIFSVANYLHDNIRIKGQKNSSWMQQRKAYKLHLFGKKTINHYNMHIGYIIWVAYI